MKEFFEELMYMCSANNTKSRGLYIFIVVAMAALLIGSVAMLVLLIINLVKGYFNLLFLVLFLVAVGILVGLIVWLKKS